ncbi:MAG: hypothetical protein ABSC05_37825 [Candidatus Solibacter sp.]
MPISRSAALFPLLFGPTSRRRVPDSSGTVWPPLNVNDLILKSVVGIFFYSQVSRTPFAKEKSALPRGQNSHVLVRLCLGVSANLKEVLPPIGGATRIAEEP